MGLNGLIRVIGYIGLGLKGSGKLGLKVIHLRFKGLKGDETYRLGL
jgi:hypothetical protein